MRLYRFSFTIHRGMDVVAIVVIALWLLGLSADTWSTIVTSLTLSALGTAVLGARFQPERVRAFCVAAAISGWAYFFFFASPTLARGAAEPYRRITNRWSQSQSPPLAARRPASATFMTAGR